MERGSEAVAARLCVAWCRSDHYKKSAHGVANYSLGIYRSDLELRDIDHNAGFQSYLPVQTMNGYARLKERYDVEHYVEDKPTSIRKHGLFTPVKRRTMVRPCRCFRLEYMPLFAVIVFPHNLTFYEPTMHAKLQTVVPGLAASKLVLRITPGISSAWQLSLKRT